MLYRLLLMRHAKSSPATLEMSDHERPLNDKGKSDAPKIAEKLIQLGHAPQLVLCSDSQRTMDTWRGIASFFRADTDFRQCPELYNSDTDAYLERMTTSNFAGQTLMVIGHNPTMEDLVLTLANEQITMKPAQVAVLETDADSFNEALLRFGQWKLVKVLIP